jgi:transcriptional regulator with XRE-family HTH domain
MAPHPYGEILARNIRAARSRLDIGQDNVAARMRALGYDAWIRQTVSSTERGRRRPTAEEIFALAYVLHTSIQALMAPTADDKVIDLPSGAALDAGSVYRSTTGMNDGGILWDGDEPNFDAENAPVDLINRHWPPVGMSAGTGQRIRDLQDQVTRLQQQLEERG